VPVEGKDPNASVTVEEDRFVIVPYGSTQRWTVYRPIDPHGEGYVHNMLVELSDEGLTASGLATFEGRAPENLQDFLIGLAKDWRGWPGIRPWTSMKGEMTLEASHDGQGHVTIAVTLRRAERTYDPDAWSARIALTLEAGEELRRLADDAEHFLHP
jgi:hypothetical protein